MSQKQPYPRKTAIRRASLSEVGRHLSMSRERVRQFITEGVFELLSDGRLDLDKSRISYIHRLRDRPALRSAAEERVREARAIEIEMRTKQRAGELTWTSDSLAAMETVCGTVRTEFGGLPARCTRDLPMRQVIDREVDGCLNRIGDRLKKEIAKLKGDGATEEPAPLDNNGKARPGFAPRG